MAKEAAMASSPAQTSRTYGSLLHQLGIQQGDALAEEGESPRVLSVLSSLLQRMVAANDACSASSSDGVLRLHRLTLFHGLRAPAISVQRYAQRIFKYANCSASCFVVACVYLDRFIQQQPELPITSLNVHRLLITSVMTAAKFLDDAYYNNAYYAKVGGVSTQEMNMLELEFLFRLGFRLHVTVQVFDSYCAYLEQELLELNAYACVEQPLPLNPLQERHCIMEAGRMAEEVHDAEQQSNNVFVAVNIMESVS